MNTAETSEFGESIVGPNRIVLVDDCETFRRYLRELFELRGFEVHEARDGNEGMLAYLERDPDVVVTDLIMPEKEGLAMITELRRYSAHLPIVAVSAYGVVEDNAYLRAAFAFGADATLRKPIDEARAFATIDELLVSRPVELRRRRGDCSRQS